MTKIQTGKISDLTPDQCNPNAGTERGQYMLTESVQRLGLGRSIVVDKHRNIIAGNKTHAIAGQVGLDETIIVKTTGNQLVVVQRDDLDLNADTSSEAYQRARELTIADNRAGEVGLEWDSESFEEYQGEGIDLDAWFMPEELDQIFDETTSGFAGAEVTELSPATEEGDRSSSNNGHLIPLAIVLDSTQARQWKAYKEAIGARSDTKAFLELLGDASS